MSGAGDSKLAALAARLESEDPEQRRRAIVELAGGWVAGALPLLVRALADDDWRVRKAAAARVIEWPDVDTAVAELCAALRDQDDVGMRNSAVEALVGIGGPAVAPLLGELGGDGPHRKFVIDTLGAIGSPEAVPELLGTLEDPDPNHRIAAAEALRNIGGEPAEAALRGCLEADDLQLRLAALDGLAVLGARVPVAEIEPTLDQPILRNSGLSLLGWSRDPAAVPALMAALEERRSTRLRAVVALANLLETTGGAAAAGIAARLGTLSPEAGRAVAGLISDRGEELETRRAAARLVGVAGVADAVAPLVDGLLDPELNQACRQALAGFGTRAAAPLVALARDAGPELRVELFDLLVALGADGGALEQLLVGGLDDDDPEVRAAAARGLAGLTALEAAATVRAGLEQALGEDDDEEVAGAAATALGRLGGAGLIDGARAPLEAALEGPAAEVRAAAALALAELGDPAVVDRLADHLADQDSFARLAAIRALASTGEAGRGRLSERLRRETDAEMVEAIRAALDPEGGSER